MYVVLEYYNTFCCFGCIEFQDMLEGFTVITKHFYKNSNTNDIQYMLCMLLNGKTKEMVHLMMFMMRMPSAQELFRNGLNNSGMRRLFQ